MISGCIGRKLEQVVVLRSKRSNTGFELDDRYAENRELQTVQIHQKQKPIKRTLFVYLRKEYAGVAGPPSTVFSHMIKQVWPFRIFSLCAKHFLKVIGIH